MTAFIQLDVLGGPMEAAPMRRTPVRAHMRRVQGPPPPTGAQLRDAALVRMTADAATQHALEYVRAKLVELYRMRVAAWPSNQTPFVNADDVARIIREWPECPPEIHARRSQDWRGAVFRKGWAKTGTYSRSLRPHMRATDLPGWRPLDAAESHSTTRAQRRTA
jgi:hypothetical protein